MYASVSTQQPAAICALKTPADAIHVLEAVRVGLVPRVTRRLTGHERALIRAGSVWVWEEEETNMRRWTDGRRWGASRVGGGGFLVYTESSESVSPPPTSTSPTDARLRRPDQLVKQTYSTSMTDPSSGKVKKFHVVAYSSRRHPQGEPHNPLPLPHQLPLLASLKVTPGIWPEWEQRRDIDPITGQRKHIHVEALTAPGLAHGQGHGHGYGININEQAYATSNASSKGASRTYSSGSQHSSFGGYAQPADERYHPYRASRAPPPPPLPLDVSRRASVGPGPSTAPSSFPSYPPYPPYPEPHHPDRRGYRDQMPYQPVLSPADPYPAPSHPHSNPHPPAYLPKDHDYQRQNYPRSPPVPLHHQFIPNPNTDQTRYPTASVLGITVSSPPPVPFKSPRYGITDLMNDPDPNGLPQHPSQSQSQPIIPVTLPPLRMAIDETNYSAQPSRIPPPIPSSAITSPTMHSHSHVYTTYVRDGYVPDGSGHADPNMGVKSERM